tara:strand:- start:595 stop:1668 length:1074 start_codon:yes stop_codon:yes gene_type:complete
MLYVSMMSGLSLLRFGMAEQGRTRNQLYYLVFFGLFLFCAFRYEVGCDWSGYYYQYLRAGDLGLEQVFSGREPIWWLILSAQRYFDLPYPWANVAASLVFFAGLHVLARRQPDPLAFLILAFPILIVNMPMSGIRQGAAIGMLCVAISAYIDRRVFSFMFWVVVAAGFHSSAMIFLLLAPMVSGKKITSLRIVMTALLAIPGIFFLIGGDAADVAIDRYVHSEVDALGALFRVTMLLLSGLFFFMFLRKPWRQTSPQDLSLVTIGAVGMVGLAALLPVSTVIADRIAYYFIPIQLMIFARIPYLPISRNRALYVALPYVGLLLVFTVWTLNSGLFQQCYLPYQSWIGGFPDGMPFGN